MERYDKQPVSMGVLECLADQNIKVSQVYLLSKEYFFDARFFFRKPQSYAVNQYRSATILDTLIDIDSHLESRIPVLLAHQQLFQ